MLRRTTIIEQNDASTNEPHMDFFIEAVQSVEQLRTHVRRFADNVNTTHGIAQLAEAVAEFNELYTLYGADAGPFSHHSMERLRQAFGALRAYHDRVLDSSKTEPYFELGRQVEQALDRLTRIIEEWEMCIDYMS